MRRRRHRLRQAPDRHLDEYILSEDDTAAHRGLRIFPSEFTAILPVMQAAQVDMVLMAFAGLNHLPRPVAFAKLQAMVRGAGLVRRALSWKRR